MTQPIASIVLVADSQQQANVLVARLRAEGIPASIDADSLVDQLTPGGTGVLVPTASLERAREILCAVEIDEAELTAQALAAPAPEREVPSSPPRARTSRWPLVLTTLAAATFLCLWMFEVEARANARNPYLRDEPTATGMRQIRIADGKLLAEWFDDDRNGAYERVTVFGESGQQTTATDDDHDGRWESFDELRKEGVVSAWSDTDGDGLHDLCVVKDAIGRELQRLQWIDGTGFVPQPR